MSFVSLGLVNVRRNLGRSILAIVSMAVASLVVTSLLSLAPSAHAAENYPQRFLLGGDIIVTKARILTQAADLNPAGNSPASWQLDRMPLDTAGLLAEAVPWPWAYGYLVPDGEGQALLTDEDLATMTGALTGLPKVAAAVPLSYLPVLERVASPDGATTAYVRSYLVGRDAAADAAWWGGYFPELIAAGSYLTGSTGGTSAGGDDGEGAAIPAVCDNARLQRGYPGTQPGARLTVFLPRARVTAAGEVPHAFDYGTMQAVELAVSGTLRTVTAAELTEAGPIYYYWGSGAILVEQEALDGLARQAGLPRAPVAGLALKATDLVDLDALTTEVRGALAGYNVFSVRELDAVLAWTGAVAPLTGEVPGAMAAAAIAPRGLPIDLNLIFAVLAFTIAAMIVAANLLVLLVERRREISILRSLGARTLDIAVMVQTEMLVLSLAGCVLGFWPVRLLSTITLLSNRLSAGRIAALTLGDFGIVCGIALGMAAAFGLLPAIASTRTTCMEALRND